HICATTLMKCYTYEYYVLPYTIGNYLADDIRTGEIPTNLPELDEAENKVRSMIDHLMNNKGEHSVDYFHKKLGKIMWNKVGMARNAQGLTEAMEEIATLREDFYKNVKVSGTAESFN